MIKGVSLEGGHPRDIQRTSQSLAQPMVPRSQCVGPGHGAALVLPNHPGNAWQPEILLAILGTLWFW